MAAAAVTACVWAALLATAAFAGTWPDHGETIMMMSGGLMTAVLVMVHARNDRRRP